MRKEPTLNRRVSGIAPSLTLSIAAKAKALAKSGVKVWSFSAGEPDFDTPEHIKREAAAKLAEGHTKYSPSDGIIELREAIAEKLARDNGLRYAANEIVVSNGAKQSLFNVLLAICEEGDEVILPGPYWLSYPEMISVAGARTVVVQAREEDGFKATVDEIRAAVTDSTKAIVINSPSNPTGAAYSEEELREIAELAVREKIFVISDEVYEKMIYGGARHVSMASFSDEARGRTITVNGFSKTYSMTGWRLGYCAGPKRIIEAVSALQSHSTSGPNTFAQYGGVRALRGPQECVAEMTAAFERRRDLLHGLLTAVDGVRCVKPDGAFYMFPNISESGLDSVSFAERLLEKEHVAVVPGVVFGSDRHVRLSYACSNETIERGMDGFRRFRESL